MVIVPSDMHSWRVLIASDVPDEAELLLRQLERVGVACTPSDVYSLAEAPEQADLNQPNLVFVLFEDLDDRALDCIAQIRRFCASHLSAVGPADDASVILTAQRAGVDEYLDAAKLAEEVVVSINRLRAKAATAASSATRRGQIIAFLGAGGGVGASFLAANVATALARKHEQCGLLDLRISAGDQSGLLNIEPEYTLADLAQEGTQIDQSVLDGLLTRHESGVHLVAAPRGLAHGARINGTTVKRVLSLATARFSHVVVDLDSRNEEHLAHVIPLCQRLVVVLRLDFTSIRNAQSLLASLEAMRFDSNRLMLVANRYHQPKELPLRRVEEVMGRKIQAFVVDDPARVNRTINEGHPIVGLFPRSQVAKQIGQLAKNLNGVLPKPAAGAAAEEVPDQKRKQRANWHSLIISWFG